MPAKGVDDLGGRVGDGERKTVFIAGNVGFGACDHAVGDGHQAHGIETMIAGEFGKADAEDGPEEKPGDVAKTAAKKRDCFEQESERSGERHGGECDYQEWREQGDGVEMRIFSGEELHGHGGDGEYDDHRREDREIAEEFAESVGKF